MLSKILYPLNLQTSTLRIPQKGSMLISQFLGHTSQKSWFKECGLTLDFDTILAYRMEGKSEEKSRNILPDIPTLSFSQRKMNFPGSEMFPL